MSNIDKEIKQMEDIDFELVKEYIPSKKEILKLIKKNMIK